MPGARTFVRKSMMVFVGRVIPASITSIKFYMCMYAHTHIYWRLFPLHIK